MNEEVDFILDSAKETIFKRFPFLFMSNTMIGSSFS